MTTALARLLLPVVCALALLLGPGCENKLSTESYELIQNDMDLVQVEDILGGPGEVQAAAGVGIGADGLPQMQKADGDTTAYLWGNESVGIIVKFRDGKVYHKQKMGL
ncbi:MAG: hypothetical protein IT431_07835 [Phycisphaerales bacterium]|nr:hypothetical protein [Phycisphaerales bacterium]